MAKRRKHAVRKNHFSSATGWFAAILIIAAVASFIKLDSMMEMYVTYILAIAGAIVAMINIRIAEEKMFLISVAALVIINMGLVGMGFITNSMLEAFLGYLSLAFGVAGFIVALAVIAKLGIDI